MATNSSRLFEPITIGRMQLQHRVAMCPMTRCRVTQDYVPKPIVKDYYRQRACVPGTLIISEGIVVSRNLVGGFSSPGIWSQEQIAAWREITREVHRQGSFIVAQLFAFGRAATEEGLKKEGLELIGPSPIPMDEGSPTPRALTIDEIEQVIDDFATAARNAIAAGFDGVECHGANGYLLNQFLQEVSNQRHDIYGGSIENRSRVVVRVLKAIAEAIGADRVGLRLSPFSSFQGMSVPDPIPQHEHIIRQADDLGLMYLSMVEGRVSGTADVEVTDSLEFAYRIWNRPLLVAGGYTAERAKALVDIERPRKDLVVMFGRYFVSNPDLVHRVRRGISLTRYNRGTFYAEGSEGYTDYPESQDFLQYATAQG